MRLRTIWTLRSMSFAERLRRSRDWAAMEVAARLPLRVRYWCTLQEVGRATRGSEDIMATPFDEVLQNLNQPKVVT
jgi:hypothetical protein